VCVCVFRVLLREKSDLLKYCSEVVCSESESTQYRDRAPRTGSAPARSGAHAAGAQDSGGTPSRRPARCGCGRVWRCGVGIPTKLVPYTCGRTVILYHA
jgi:hypothetical protein